LGGPPATTRRGPLICGGAAFAAALAVEAPRVPRR
jgi:hypothetical protein